MKAIKGWIILSLALIISSAGYSQTAKKPASLKTTARWIHLFTNFERVKIGLAPLACNTNLDNAAIWQSQYCAKIKNLSHSANVTGMKSVGDRIKYYGETYRTCGENVAVMYPHSSESALAYAILDGWMNSPGHKRNILNPGFKSMGVGVAVGSYSSYTGYYYSAQVFTGNEVWKFDNIEVDKISGSTESIRIKLTGPVTNGESAPDKDWEKTWNIGIAEVGEKDDVTLFGAEKGQDNTWTVPNKLSSTKEYYIVMLSKKDMNLYPVKYFKLDTLKTVKLEIKPNRYATILTSMGTMKLELFENRAPITTANFIKLSEKGFYNGLIFHRVIKNFMIQGGCPDGTGRGGPGYKIRDEFHPTLGHIGSGILSMANAGPNTGGSQFFITLRATPWLDGKHTVFGKIVQGMDVLMAIGEVKTKTGDRPVNPVVIQKITISQQ